MDMNYVDSFDLFGVKARQKACIPGEGAPTSATKSAVGDLYMDTVTGDIYKCIAVTDGVYTWKPLGVGGGNVLTVWVEGDEADHTSSEIYDHVANHRGPVQLHCNDGYYQLLRVEAEGSAYFGYIADEQLIKVVLIYGNSVERYEHHFVSLDNINEAIHDLVKTVNGIAPDENGNVEIEAGGLPPMLVHIDYDTGMASHTSEDIHEHVVYGGVVYLIVEGVCYIGLTDVDYNYAVFTESTGMQNVIYPDGTSERRPGKIGDIYTALDHIIALQEELIG